MLTFGVGVACVCVCVCVCARAVCMHVCIAYVCVCVHVEFCTQCTRTCIFPVFAGWCEDIDKLLQGGFLLHCSEKQLSPSKVRARRQGLCCQQGSETGFRGAAVQGVLGGGNGGRGRVNGVPLVLMRCFGSSSVRVVGIHFVFRIA